jgi:hypothetical protein
MVYRKKKTIGDDGPQASGRDQVRLPVSWGNDDRNRLAQDADLHMSLTYTGSPASRDTSKVQRPRGAKVRKVFDNMFRPYVARAVKAGKMWRDVKTLPEVRV